MALFYLYPYVFTVRCHASAVYAIVHSHVSLFVTSQCSVEVAKHRITQKQCHIIGQRLFVF